MLGLRLAPRLFVIWLAAITLVLMSASMMAAQTPVATVEKAAVESSAAAPETAPKIFPEYKRRNSDSSNSQG